MAGASLALHSVEREWADEPHAEIHKPGRRPKEYTKYSRQEEAQRLGRILRPKSDGGLAYFYSIVTRDTRDQEFSANRQLFLTEQGYRYIIEDAEMLLAS